MTEVSEIVGFPRVGSQARGPQRKSPFPCTGMDILLFALRSCLVLVDMGVLSLTKELMRLIRG